MRRASLLLLAISILGVFAGAAQARTIHVSPDGRDDRAGTASAPLRTVGQALYVSQPGDVVELAPGNYPKPARIGSKIYTDKRDHGTGVTVRAPQGGATVEGLRLQHARGITFEGIEWTGTLEIYGGGRLEIRQNRFTTTSSAITLRGGAESVTIDRNHFKGVGSGVKAPGYGTSDPNIARISSGIRITNNVMEDVRIDGIQAGYWRDVLIEGNVMRRLAGVTKLHHDGIQFFGHMYDVRILRNRITESDGQGMFIAAQYGPIQNVRIEGNLIARTKAVSLYAIGVDGLVLAGNTVWRYHGAFSTAAAIALKNRDGSATPSNAVIFGNIASAMETYMPVAVKDYNLVGRRTARYAAYNAPGAHELIADPLFVDALAWDFHLGPLSPARALLPGTLGGLGADLDGRPRPALGPLGAYGS